MRRGALARWIYFSVGWVFFAAGAVGAFLPALPTTPFMILALWCFSQSSQRFQHWLYTHRLFGPPLQKWQRHRVIPLPVKLIAWASMVASTSYLWVRGDVPLPVLLVISAVMLFGALFIARFPSA